MTDTGPFEQALRRSARQAERRKRLRAVAVLAFWLVMVAAFLVLVSRRASQVLRLPTESPIQRADPPSDESATWSRPQVFGLETPIQER